LWHLQTFILNQAPRKTLDWADKVANWDFQRIVTCHDSPIQAGPRQFRQAFAFLETLHSCELVRKWMRPTQEDFKFLRELEESLTKRGITTPPREKLNSPWA